MKINDLKRVLGLQDPPNVSEKAPHYESDPTVLEWLSDVLPSKSQFGQYLIRLLPFTQWIRHYNFQWFWGDLVAGMNLVVMS
jgi:sodium-independent sulfate anion transporter 11